MFSIYAAQFVSLGRATFSKRITTIRSISLVVDQGEDLSAKRHLEKSDLLFIDSLLKKDVLALFATKHLSFTGHVVCEIQRSFAAQLIHVVAVNYPVDLRSL